MSTVTVSRSVAVGFAQAAILRPAVGDLTGLVMNHEVLDGSSGGSAFTHVRSGEDNLPGTCDVSFRRYKSGQDQWIWSRSALQADDSLLFGAHRVWRY